MQATSLRRQRRWRLRHWASLPLLVLLASAGPPAFAAAATSAGDSGQALRCEPAKFRAVIDVGHTSDAGGALSARGIFEYQFNLRLAKQIVAKLVDMGFAKTSLLVVSGKGHATLFARTVRANAINADLLLSVHHDSVQDVYLERWTFNGKQQLFSDKYRCYSIFVSRRNPRWDGSIGFAKMLADNLKSRGVTFTSHHAGNIEGERRELIESDRACTGTRTSSCSGIPGRRPCCWKPA